MKKLIIFGNGEIADLASYYFKSEQDINTEAYIIDGKNLKEDKFNNIPVISLEEIKQNFSNELYDVHIAISYNKLNQNREKKFNEIKKMNYNFRSFVSKKSFISSKAKLIGRNLFILENQVIQNNVEINDNVMIWSGNHIGHGSKILPHVYISSHCVISGHCEVGERCFIGVNSAMSDFTNIGKDCFIGMSSNISGKISSDSTVVGDKSKIYGSESKFNKILKKKYFG